VNSGNGARSYTRAVGSHSSIKLNVTNIKPGFVILWFWDRIYKMHQIVKFRQVENENGVLPLRLWKVVSF